MKPGARGLSVTCELGQQDYRVPVCTALDLGATAAMSSRCSGCHGVSAGGEGVLPGAHALEAAAPLSPSCCSGICSVSLNRVLTLLVLGFSVLGMTH